MDEFTSEQKDQLKSWAGQRDTVLAEISVNKVENEKLSKANKELAASFTKIQDEINQCQGRLEEMTRKENEYNTLVALDNAELNSQKTYLETRVMDLKVEISMLESQKDSIVKDITILSDVSEKVFSRANVIDSDIEEIKKTNKDNLRESASLVGSIKDELKQIHELNASNIEKANVVINELPKIIFDLQRDIIERKKFNKTKHT
jgi:chromosome segregation ATPase